MAIFKFISTPKGANVLIDDTYFGVTPLTVRDVKTGFYQYSIILNDEHIDGNVIVGGKDTDEKIIEVEFQEQEEEETETSQEEVTPTPEPTPSSPSENELLLKHLDDMNKILSSHLDTMNTILDRNNEVLTTINDYIRRTTGIMALDKHYNTDRTTITVSTPTQPETPDIIANANTTPPTPGYDRIPIHETLGRNSETLYMVNDGTSDIFVVKSSDGLVYSKSEIPVLVGEMRTFHNIWELRVRSPSAGNITTLKGGIYRVSEYFIRPSYASIVTNPNFKTSSTALSTSTAGILIPAVSGQRFRITHIDMTARNDDASQDGTVFLYGFFSGNLQIIASLIVPFGAGDFAVAKASTPANMLVDVNTNISVTAVGSIVFRVSIGGTYETI